MKLTLKAGIPALLVALAGIGLYWRALDAPRLQSLACLTQLERALNDGHRDELLELVILPATIQHRSAAEQSEFLAKALKDEISQAGLAALKRRGNFGPLKELFPDQADAWAGQAGLNPDDCVAFMMENNGLRAEVILVKPSRLASPQHQDGATARQPSTMETPYRVARLNNVKQMAATTTLSSAEKTP